MIGLQKFSDLSLGRAGDPNSGVWAAGYCNGSREVDTSDKGSLRGLSYRAMSKLHVKVVEFSRPFYGLLCVYVCTYVCTIQVRVQIR